MKEQPSARARLRAAGRYATAFINKYFHHKQQLRAVASAGATKNEELKISAAACAERACSGNSAESIFHENMSPKHIASGSCHT